MSFEGKSLRTPPSNNGKVHFSEEESDRCLAESDPSSASKASRALHDFTSNSPVKSFASIVAGQDSNLVSKWLPTSTSSLAEPLEREELARERATERSLLTDEKRISRGILTPPFTPLRRIDEHIGSNKTPLNNQFTTIDRLKSRASLLTPPDTLKQDQIRNYNRGNVLELSPDHGSTYASPARGSSPYALESSEKQKLGVKSLTEQLKNLVADENARRRSVSSPTEPSFDFNRHPNISHFFDSSAAVDPTTRDTLNFSAENEDVIAEFRKRADTFCSTPSVPLPPPTSDGSPPSAPNVNAFLNQSVKVNNGRASQGPGLTSFSTISSSIFASNHPSAHAFSSPAPFSSVSASRLDDSIGSISPRPQRACGSPQKSPQPTVKAELSASAFNVSNPNHRMLPSEDNPLAHSAPSTRRQTLSFEEVARNHEALALGRERSVEERSYSLVDPSRIDLINSRFINPHFRPRSITLGDTGAPKVFNKSHLSVNWDESDAERIEEDSHKGDSTSGRTGSSARSSLVGLDSLPVSQLALAKELGATSHPFDSTSLARSNIKPPSVSTRYCKVLGLSPKLLGSMKGIVRVRNAFSAYGDLLDIYVDTLSPLGFILLGFHDIRSVASMIESGVKTLEASFGSYLKFETVQRHEVVQLTCDLKNPILSTNEGVLELYFNDPRGIITQEILTEYLQRYGELKSLKLSGPKKWIVEWYDDRRATSAQKQLNSRDFADFQVIVDVPERTVNPTFDNLPLDRLSLNSPFNPNVCLLPPTVRPPPSMINPADQYNNGLLYRYMGDPYASNYFMPCSHSVSERNPSRVDLNHRQHQNQQVLSMVNRPRAFPFPGVPPSNVIDLDRIECGSDPRTTCMIKNIPNKITDAMLFKFVHEVCPRGFDFLYLRMDFKARLNVGYAFINFLSVENVLRFAKSKLGVKWGVFLSEKTVQMCYASIQGKENLIEKCKLAIMEEEESFRPKVYYSNGPQIGLPEPFPHANDLQRKARSQANAALSARQLMTAGNVSH
ncbi:hypothetical protein BY996DRAFT_6429540 [Phakopsora pachyrhizi]|nr:hypothetical protein BY996DRAFT_6429540 [Phakopsora pachyrhizi]